MRLKLPLYENEAIHTGFSDPRDRLLHVIIAVLKRAEPTPTWRVIIEALRNPVVNLSPLAQTIETTHFPDPTATRDVVAEGLTTGMSLSTPFISNWRSHISIINTESAATSTDGDDEVKSKQSTGPVPTAQGEIKYLKHI